MIDCHSLAYFRIVSENIQSVSRFRHRGKGADVNKDAFNIRLNRDTATLQSAVFYINLLQN